MLLVCIVNDESGADDSRHKRSLRQRCEKQKSDDGELVV